MPVVAKHRGGPSAPASAHGGGRPGVPREAGSPRDGRPRGALRPAAVPSHGPDSAKPRRATLPRAVPSPAEVIMVPPGRPAEGGGVRWGCGPAAAAQLRCCRYRPGSDPRRCRSAAARPGSAAKGPFRQDLAAPGEAARGDCLRGAAEKEPGASGTAVPSGASLLRVLRPGLPSLPPPRGTPRAPRTPHTEPAALRPVLQADPREPRACHTPCSRGKSLTRTHLPLEREAPVDRMS